MSEPVKIERVLDAPRERVWKAWTTEDEIKKWWGPKGFTAPTIKMDFKEGGQYLYCMHGPAGTEFDVDMYSGGQFQEIVPMEKIVATDYFADKDGNKVHPSAYGMGEMPEEMHLSVTFEDVDENKTKLTLTYSDEIPADHLKDMTQGWNESLDKLNESVK